MSGSTSVPNITFGPTGFVAPLESAILVGIQEDWNAALGGNLNPAMNTPQGQIEVSEAALVGNGYNQQVALFNGVDPAYASGRMQDAIARIYKLTRIPSQPTALQVACGGLVGVVIPVDARIADDQGNIYQCTGAGTIPVGGSITLGFAAVIAGPTAVPATVSIFQAIPGWNTASVASGVVGQNTETRAEFEARRQLSLSKNGAGFLPAIQGIVLEVPGVIECYVTENYTGAPVTVQGVTLDANSLYVCVAGGAAADVAQAIWIKKNPGCGYTGNHTETVYDTSPGYSPPYPSYSVTFQIPDAVYVCMSVTLANSSQVPSNAAALVQAAIQSAFTGADGGLRATIGSTIYASRYYAGVASLGTWAQIISIQIGISGNPTVTFTGSIAGVTLTTSSPTGTIAIGQFVFGTNVAPGTIITAGSGSSWTVSVNQTVASTAMSGVAAVNNDVDTQIDWLPSLFNADVNVILV